MGSRVLFIVVLVLVAGTPGLMAQEEATPEKTLMGRVIDSDTGTPLLGAFVHLQEESWGVVTDEEGTFTLPRLPDGPLSVAVEQLGYVDLVQVFRNPEGEVPVLFALTPDPILLEGIEVVMDLIRSRSFLKPYPCPSKEIESTCALIRGRLRTVSVYVDEQPFWGGLDLLTMVQPHELHMVEIFSSRGQVRVYTEGFMERAGNRPVAVMPLHW